MRRYVVVYDIPADKRRNRIHKTMKDFGIPVQESVFEVDLREEDLLRLQNRLEELIDAKTDSVIFYPLCQRCAGAAVRIGVSQDPYASRVTIL